MNQLKKTIIAAVSCSIIFCGCYGNFTLTKKLYEFNGGVSDKYIKSGVTFILGITGIYFLAGVVDIVFLNLIEFWTGSNPLTMEEDQIEEQVVTKNGKSYKITASKNRFDITSLDETSRTVSLLFNPENKSWFVHTHDQVLKVAEVESENILKLLLPEEGTLLYNTENNSIISRTGHEDLPGQSGRFY